MPPHLMVNRRPRRNNGRKVRQSPHYEHVELWALRLLTSFESYLYDLWDNDRISWLVLAGLSAQVIGSGNDGRIRTQLRRRLREIESQPLKRVGPIFTNICFLADAIGLNPVETEILTFAAIATRNHYLRACLRAMSMATREFAIQVLCCTLQMPEADIRVACQRDSTLSKVDLLFNDDNGYSDVEEMLNLDDELAQRFFIEHESQAQFIGNFFDTAPLSDLTAADYPHLKTDLRVILGYLRHAVESRKPGVNILIYGPPGTGKSQLARVIADSLQVSLYKISDHETEVELELGAAVRLVSYRMCQVFLSRAYGGMVVFDEMEDIFPSDISLFGGRQGRHGHNKAAINNTLETNPVPTIWISNDIHYLDPAYLRRFDYAVELRAPPRSVRRNIIQRYFADLPLPESCLANLAEHDDLTPAQVERVAKVARGSGIVAPDDLGKAVERMIDSTMTMMRQRKSPRKTGRSIDFGIEFLSIETPIDLLIQGIRESGSCRLCFYGPPGTGKTSLARHLAEALDRPLIVKRASDLLGRFVGETEQNIASMFDEARDEGAVLLLDEGDSFLQDRQTAHQSWEVTQVNELLTQMESFDGIFICATNLMDRFDPASLRRFDFKMRFDYLNAQQRRGLLSRHLDELGYTCTATETEDLRRSIKNLANLTPGDFAVANRQCRVMCTKASPSFFLAALQAECEGKPGWSRKLGFV